MLVYEKVLRPMAFAACFGDAERVHDLSMKLLQREGVQDDIKKYVQHVSSELLQQEFMGIRFKNPVGLAAGLDKNAVALKAWENFGFGHVEFGGVTPRPQSGNPKRRMFSLWRDRSLINRMGFNNEGIDAVVKNITNTPYIDVPIGANITVNKENAENIERAIKDYVACFQAFYNYVQYFSVNISSPNTKGLRDLVKYLPEILQALSDAEKEMGGNGQKPIVVKVSIDMPWDLFEECLSVLDEFNVGLELTNTTVMRGGIVSTIDEVGGLSGPPLFRGMIERVKFTRRNYKDMLIIAIGGISNARDAIEALLSGANLVQVFTAFVVQDPWIVPHINKGVLAYMQKENMKNITDFQHYWR